MTAPTRLRDIQLGPRGSDPAGLTRSGGLVMFAADDGSYGRELWISDGTTAGTRLVRNLAPGGLGANPLYLTAFAGGVLFSANDGTTPATGLGVGRELYRSDGTAAGTWLVTDINQTLESSSDPEGLVQFAGSVWFAATGTVDGPELWRSRGGAATTIKVADLTLTHPRARGSQPRHLTPVGPLLFFSADDGRHGRELHASTATDLPRLVIDINTTAVAGFQATASAEVADLTALATTLCFTADNGSHGRELWRSDGTAAGTRLVLDLHPGAVGSNPSQLTAVGERLFFVADDGSHGAELWQTDGTAAGTRLVHDIHSGPSGSSPGQLTVVGATLYFSADDGDGGRELWRSDGTAAGTRLVGDIHPGPAGSNPDQLLAVGDSLYFSADDGQHGRELWRSDGSSDGTRLVADLNPTGSAAPADLTLLGASLLFGANDGSSGRELWSLEVASDLPLVSITASPPQQPEGQTGTTPFRFVVERRGPSSGISRVSWRLTTGLATPTGGSLVFKPGHTRQIISVALPANRLQQPDRPITVILEAAQGASLDPATSSATAIARNDDWIGGSADDRLIGSAAADWLDGSGGQDQLSGGEGADRLAFRHGESPLHAPDRITDFQLGRDRLVVLQPNGALRARPASLSRATDNASATTLLELAAAVVADADGGRPGSQPLAAGAAALVVASHPAIAGTYVLINNFNSSLQSQADLMVNISGHSGVLPAPGPIAPAGLFSPA